jgi:hypothetical protein
MTTDIALNVKLDELQWMYVEFASGAIKKNIQEGDAIKAANNAASLAHTILKWAPEVRYAD